MAIHRNDEDHSRRALAAKVWHRRWHYRSDFQPVLAALLRERWNGIFLIRLELTTSGNLVGAAQVGGVDIALLEPQPLLGLCPLSVAIRTICNIAESEGLTFVERAYLLNGLPR